MNQENKGATLSNLRLLGADVRLTCNGCMWSKVYALEDVIARLVKRGLAGEEVRVRDVARHTTIACPRCGARAWETRPDLPYRRPVEW